MELDEIYQQDSSDIHSLIQDLEDRTFKHPASVQIV